VVQPDSSEQHGTHRDVNARTTKAVLQARRRPVRDRDRAYEIDAAESRALAIIGAFRVVAEGNLHDIRDESQSARRSLKHLKNEGLIRTSPLSSDDRAVTLTDRGRDLLESESLSASRRD
jgi:chromosome segregation and condensation protein ScpB